MNDERWQTGKPNDNRMVEVMLCTGEIKSAWILNTGNWSEDFVMVWREKFPEFNIDLVLSHLSFIEAKFSRKL